MYVSGCEWMGSLLIHKIAYQIKNALVIIHSFGYSSLFHEALTLKPLISNTVNSDVGQTYAGPLSLQSFNWSYLFIMTDVVNLR